MSARAVHLVIDARPRGPRGPAGGRGGTGPERARSPARPGGRAGGPQRAGGRPRARGGTSTGFASWPSARAAAAWCSSADRLGRMPRSCGPIASTTRRGCRRGLRRGRSPESAVIWRLDRPESLSTAEEELTRRLTYQPLGKYWAFPAGAAAGGAALPDLDPAQRPDTRRRRP